MLLSTCEFERVTPNKFSLRNTLAIRSRTVGIQDGKEKLNSFFGDSNSSKSSKIYLLDILIEYFLIIIAA